MFGKMKKAKKLFENRQKIIQRHLNGDLDMNEDILVGEVVKSTMYMLMEFDALVPMDYENIPANHTKIVNDFLYYYHETLLPEIKDKLNQSIPTFTVDNKWIFKRVVDKKWKAKSKPNFVEYYDNRVSNAPSDYYKTMKGSTVQDHPLVYSPLIFRNDDELKFKLIVCLGIIDYAPITWNKLILMLYSMETFEDYTEYLPAMA